MLAGSNEKSLLVNNKKRFDLGRLYAGSNCRILPHDSCKSPPNLGKVSFFNKQPGVAYTSTLLEYFLIQYKHSSGSWIAAPNIIFLGGRIFAAASRAALICRIDSAMMVKGILQLLGICSKNNHSWTNGSSSPNLIILFSDLEVQVYTWAR